MRFSLDTNPPFESAVRWVFKFPGVKPIVRRRNVKSADAHSESAVRITSRAGSWTRRLNFVKSTIGLVIGISFSGEQGSNQNHVIAPADHGQRSPNRYEPPCFGDLRLWLQQWHERHPTPKSHTQEGKP